MSVRVDVFPVYLYKDKEIWKDVPKSNGLYQVSNHGRARSMVRPGVREIRILKPTVHLLEDGTYSVRLGFAKSHGGSITLARMVATLFLPPPEDPKDDVVFKDGNTLNFHHSNLKWATQQIKCNKKLLPADLQEIRRTVLSGVYNMSEMARKYNVSYNVMRTHVAKIIRRKRWEDAGDNQLALKNIDEALLSGVLDPIVLESNVDDKSGKILHFVMDKVKPEPGEDEIQTFLLHMHCMRLALKYFYQPAHCRYMTGYTQGNFKGDRSDPVQNNMICEGLVEEKTVNTHTGWFLSRKGILVRDYLNAVEFYNGQSI